MVKVKTNSRKNEIERLTHQTKDLLSDITRLDTYKVYVKEPPIDGKANKAIIKLVAEHFNIGLSCINIVSGNTSKTKIIEIKD